MKNVGSKALEILLDLCGVFQTSILVCGKINRNFRLVFAVNINVICVLSNPSRHYQNATPKSVQTSAHFERFSSYVGKYMA